MLNKTYIKNTASKITGVTGNIKILFSLSGSQSAYVKYYAGGKTHIALPKLSKGAPISEVRTCLELLTHELIHVGQVRDGRLTYDFSNRVFNYVIDGVSGSISFEEYSTTDGHDNSPFEVEARRLTKECLKNVK